MARHIIITLVVLLILVAVFMGAGQALALPTSQDTYDPLPFQSTRELTEWVEEWEPWDIAYGTYDLSSRCENGAWAMFIDMVNQNRLAGFQIDPHRQHMIVIVPIPGENRYLFVDGTRITPVFAGREWRIN